MHFKAQHFLIEGARLLKIVNLQRAMADTDRLDQRFFRRTVRNRQFLSPMENLLYNEVALSGEAALSVKI